MKKVYICRYAYNGKRGRREFESFDGAFAFIGERLFSKFDFSILINDMKQCRDPYFFSDEFVNDINTIFHDVKYPLPEFLYMCEYCEYSECEKGNWDLDYDEQIEDCHRSCNGCEYHKPCPGKNICDASSCDGNIDILSPHFSISYRIDVKKPDYSYDCEIIHRKPPYKNLHVKINRIMKYSPNEYPFLFLLAVSDEPHLQEEIIRIIKKRYHNHIGREAAKTHLTNLQNLGFIIKTENGYVLNRDASNCPSEISAVSAGHSCYALLVLKVLDANPKKQQQIADEIESKYGIRIERKAIGRHLQNLMNFDFGVNRVSGGYCIPESK